MVALATIFAEIVALATISAGATNSPYMVVATAIGTFIRLTHGYLK